MHLARHFSTEIISADSRQCFRELSIGVARPSEEELAAVPHHFIASHSIHEKVTAATFKQYALQKTEELFTEKDVVIMAGGTGLYIRAFCEGLDEVPEVPATVREGVIEDYKTGGLEVLQEQAKQLDPLFYEKGEIQNPQRLMRALEVIKATGRSILDFHKAQKTQRPFNVIKIGLELPREVLYNRINKRVDAMMEAGLLAEVTSLLPYQDVNALQTVGYKELFVHLQGEASLEEAVTQIKTNTRHYAKRQLTWFKKDEGFRWFQPDDHAKIKEHLAGAL